MEIWKDIKNYEGLYQASSLGRIRRLPGKVKSGIKHSEYRTIKGGMLKQNLKRNGYLTVDLSKNYQVKTISVHRIIALTFIEKPQNEDPNNPFVVNHKNCNKQDNRVENLEWVTHKGNSEHAKENNLYNPPNRKKVKCVELNKIFNSSYEAAEYLNREYFKGTKQIKNVAAKIRSAACGIQKVAYGFNWIYCI